MWKIFHAIIKEKRFGFEEVAYLLLLRSPAGQGGTSFILRTDYDNMALEQKTEDEYYRAVRASNIMNILARSVLKCIASIRMRTTLSCDNLDASKYRPYFKIPHHYCYAYNMLCHATFGRSFHIRHPQEKLYR